MIKVVFLILAMSFAMYFYSLSNEVDDKITCKSELSAIYGGERMDLINVLSLKSGVGVMTMSGVVYNNKKTIGKISKNVGFSYKRNGDTYTMRSTVIVDSPFMELPQEIKENWFSKFYEQENTIMVMKIKKINARNLLVYTNVVPQYLCERVE